MPRPQLQIRFLRLLLPVLAVALVAALLSSGAPSTTERASAAGPFILNGVAEAVLTAPLTPNEVHSFCRFRMETTGTTANLRGMCYVVTKTSPGTPAPPPPPPPPYSALLPIVNLQILSGAISQIDGSTTLNFSPVLCLGVDTQDDPDDLPDAGLTVTLSTTASKSGAMGAGSVVLNFDKGVVDGDPFDCDQVDQTVTAPFSPTNLAMSHDSDIWAAGMTAADGCTSWEELGTNPLMGGERDPFNFWDLMDQWIGGAKNKAISGGDIASVVSRFGSSGSPTGDPTVPPGAITGYHVSADRDGSIPGGFAWDLKPPNGSVSGGDIGAVVSQFGHSCTAAPN